jgi:putative transposase
MEKTNEIRTGRHCVFNLHVHLVFVTKYRRRVFTKIILDRMENVFKTVCNDFEAELIEFDGEKDHVHLLINYPPKVPISKLVNSLKGVSSRLLRNEFPDLRNNYYKGVLWSPSYFAASCGGAPISVVKQYIQSQTTPD